ncbi:MAG TPA: lipase maturation factor family protein [Polyangiaceae bacterium]|nr:lipase maturation factor family protein [Polyangiaceae bacterium]
MDPLAQLADAPPELIWGLVSRGIGLTYFISFASLAPQVLPIAGRNGITPIAESLRAIERDFPTWKRFVYFPTLLWLGTSDALLGALPWLGMAASALVTFGGPAAPWAFAALFLIYLSLDRPVVLVYPWDCLLFEAGFWAMLLPATRSLPDLHAIAAPSPAIAWVYRLLVFRVILGFGKHKFIGTTPADSGFLKGFLVNQPLPTVPGWLGQKLPIGLLRVGLWGMFLVEIVLPWTVFFPGTWSAIGALSMLGLMAGIELTGNFGYFNVITCVLTLSWFDTRTAVAFRPAELFSANGHVFVHALVLAYSFGALVSFAFNTFCAHTWMMWPLWERIRPPFLTWPVRFVRALHSFRWLHAYGVFPPHTPPSVKIVPVVEASWDGKEFVPLSHPFSPTVETSRPRFCAPHHERFDQAVVYEAIGLNEASTMRNIVGRWDPYGYGGVPGALLFVHRVLRGDVPGKRFYDRAVERGRGRPLVARVRTYMLEPTSVEARRRDGAWWRRTLIGPHFPPMRLEDGYWEAPLPAPELWHPDDIVWLRRSHVGELMIRAEHGENVHDLVLVRSNGFDADDVRRFWDEFVPAVAAADRQTWSGLRAAVDAARAKHGRARLHRFERIAARYAVLLSAKLAVLVPKLGFANAFGFKPGAPTRLKTEHHVRLFAYHVLGSGRASYDALVADPAKAVSLSERMTMCSGLYVQALFRYEAIAYQCQKLRLMAAFTEHEGRPAPTETQRKNKERVDALIRGVVGSLDVVDFLKTQMTTAEDVLDIPEAWPRFRMDTTGEVRPVRES